MQLNENIRNFRKFRNLSQSELAKQIQKSKSVISHWESGENSPDLDSCEKLCQILKVTPNQLFGWEPHPEYEQYVKRLKQYQDEINDLRKEAQYIEAKITQLECMKYEIAPPDWDNDD